MNESINPPKGLLIGMGDRVADLAKMGPLGLLVGVVGLVAMGVFFTQDSTTAIGSWMVGWYAWMTITMGMVGLTFLHHTLRARWSLPFLRLYEAGGGPVGIAVMAILFIPIIAQAHVIYPWANPDLVAHDSMLQYKSRYLNMPFWIIRTVAYFAIWIAFTAFMRRSARRQDEINDPVVGKKMEMGRSSWGAFGILVFMLTYTFALIDWLMSLEPHWYSTMHPLWQTVASALGALGLCVAIVCVNARREPYNEVITPTLTKNWGNMMFTLTMLWAYTALSQYLIFWNGNLPDTAQYYARRSFLMWNAIGMTTLVGQFFVPWMTLLSPRVKRYPNLLCQIAGWIFVIHIVDTYLAVAPTLPVTIERVQTRAAGQCLISDIIAFLTVGGFWLASFSTQIRKAPLLVGYDQRLQEDLAHGH